MNSQVQLPTLSTTPVVGTIQGKFEAHAQCQGGLLPGMFAIHHSGTRYVSLNVQEMFECFVEFGTLR